MSLVLQIVPFSGELGMFGEPDPSSAYSLSGHVSISVAPSYSFFESRRPTRLLLQSLSLTFEGQSEIFTQSTGYSSLRLCSITRELVPSDPIELSNEGHEDPNQPCVWNIVFNLTIPGWLPESTIQGTGDFGTKYSLVAAARFMSLGADNGFSSWSPFSALCTTFRPRFRSAEAFKTIKLRRFVNPPRTEAIEVPMNNYLVSSTPSGSRRDKHRIPADVLSSIQVLVSVPDYVGMDGKEVSIAVRLRTKDLPEEECMKLQLTDVSLDLVQNEQYQCRPTSSYLAQYPIPPREMQPPNVPLRDSHPLNLAYGEFFSTNLSESTSRVFSLLPKDESGKFKLSENNYIFKDDRKERIPTWYTINTSLPFDNSSTESLDGDGDYSWTEFVGLRPSTCGPLFSVHHQLAISLMLSYDVQNGVEAKEKLSFKIPLTFANIAPVIPPPSPPRFLLFDSTVETTSPSTSSSPLPAYSQLYDSNGERKIDYSVPLPLYTPRSSQNKDGDDDELLSLLVNADKGSEKLPITAEL